MWSRCARSAVGCSRPRLRQAVRLWNAASDRSRRRNAFRPRREGGDHRSHRAAAAADGGVRGDRDPICHAAPRQGRTPEGERDGGAGDSRSTTTTRSRSPSRTASSAARPARRVEDGRRGPRRERGGGAANSRATTTTTRSRSPSRAASRRSSRSPRRGGAQKEYAAEALAASRATTTTTRSRSPSRAAFAARRARHVGDGHAEGRGGRAAEPCVQRRRQQGRDRRAGRHRAARRARHVGDGHAEGVRGGGAGESRWLNGDNRCVPGSVRRSSRSPRRGRTRRRSTRRARCGTSRPTTTAGSRSPRRAASRRCRPPSSGTDAPRRSTRQALWNLACNNDDNKVAIAEQGGIAPLIAFATSRQGTQKEYAAAALPEPRGQRRQQGRDRRAGRHRAARRARHVEADSRSTRRRRAEPHEQRRQQGRDRRAGRHRAARRAASRGRTAQKSARGGAAGPSGVQQRRQQVAIAEQGGIAPLARSPRRGRTRRIVRGGGAAEPRVQQRRQQGRDHEQADCAAHVALASGDGRAEGEAAAALAVRAPTTTGSRSPRRAASRRSSRSPRRGRTRRSTRRARCGSPRAATTTTRSDRRAGRHHAARRTRHVGDRRAEGERGGRAAEPREQRRQQGRDRRAGGGSGVGRQLVAGR